jgi:hypothetical protein
MLMMWSYWEHKEEQLIHASNEVGLEADVEKSKSELLCFWTSFIFLIPKYKKIQRLFPSSGESLRKS